MGIDFDLTVDVPIKHCIASIRGGLKARKNARLQRGLLTQTVDEISNTQGIYCYQISQQYRISFPLTRIEICFKALGTHSTDIAGTLFVFPNFARLAILFGLSFIGITAYNKDIAGFFFGVVLLFMLRNQIQRRINRSREHLVGTIRYTILEANLDH